jgi:hypothetical protein
MGSAKNFRNRERIRISRDDPPSARLARLAINTFAEKAASSIRLQSIAHLALRADNEAGTGHSVVNAVSVFLGAWLSRFAICRWQNPLRHLIRSRWSTRRRYRLRAWFSPALGLIGRGRGVGGRRGLLATVLMPFGGRAFVRGNFSQGFSRRGRRRRLGPRLWLGSDLLCALIARWRLLLRRLVLRRLFFGRAFAGGLELRM